MYISRVKRFFLLFAFFPLAFANAEEPSFRLTIGSNINNFPIQIQKTNKKIKTPFSLEFKKWNLSPNTGTFVRNKSSSSNIKNNSSSDILFVKLRYKF